MYKRQGDGEDRVGAVVLGVAAGEHHGDGDADPQQHPVGEYLAVPTAGAGTPDLVSGDRVTATWRPGDQHGEREEGARVDQVNRDEGLRCGEVHQEGGEQATGAEPDIEQGMPYREYL